MDVIYKKKESFRCTKLCHDVYAMVLIFTAVVLYLASVWQGL
jgi:hypothetical protein